MLCAITALFANCKDFYLRFSPIKTPLHLVNQLLSKMENQASTTVSPNSSNPFPIQPAMAPSVQLGFTTLYTFLYGGLFIVVYIQLWLLLKYRHKRWSYQSLFLFLCLFWAALRTTLFSFYFCNALAANHLPTPVYWLLYCCPVCLQFFTLSLINLYFTQVSDICSLSIGLA